jgi:thiosulfate/3-mercaptopyruvate sulfurtransferase
MLIAALAPLLLVLSGPPGQDTMLVSTAWLAQHLKDPSLVLLEIGPEDSYNAGHIPGAQYVNFHALMKPHNMDPKMQHHAYDPSQAGSTLSLELPAIAQLDSVLDALGISANSSVVIYCSKEWITPAARAYLTLDYAGLRGRVALLDGGLTSWQAEGRPVTTDVPTVRPGSFRSTPRNDVVVDLAWVKSHRNDPGVHLVDARDHGFYVDSIDNGMARGGHIAGAGSVPFGDLVDSTSLRLKDKTELTRMFQAAGVRPGNTVVGYCHVGQQASLVYFVARYLGYDARLYDGSFEEWSAYPDLPIEGSHRAVSTGQ